MGGGAGSAGESGEVLDRRSDDEHIVPVSLSLPSSPAEYSDSDWGAAADATAAKGCLQFAWCPSTAALVAASFATRAAPSFALWICFASSVAPCVRGT